MVICYRSHRNQITSHSSKCQAEVAHQNLNIITPVHIPFPISLPSHMLFPPPGKPICPLIHSTKFYLIFQSTTQMSLPSGNLLWLPMFLTITTDCPCAFHFLALVPVWDNYLSVHEDVSPLAYKPAKARNLLIHVVGVPSTPIGPLLRARTQLHS